jgi:hypothetical protein
MTEASVMEQVEKFRGASYRLRGFHRRHGGILDDGHPNTTRAYRINMRMLFDAEVALREGGFNYIAVYLRHAHELGVARALEGHPQDVRDQRQRDVRRLLMKYTEAFASVRGKASGQSHEDASRAPGLIDGDG